MLEALHDPLALCSLSACHKLYWCFMKELTPSSFWSNKMICCGRLAHFLHVFYFYVIHEESENFRGEKKHVERQRYKEGEVYVLSILSSLPQPAMRYFKSYFFRLQKKKKNSKVSFLLFKRQCAVFLSSYKVVHIYYKNMKSIWKIFFKFHIMLLIRCKCVTFWCIFF